ncbi:unnamed protein product [Closterium sp. Naga37s-1]|nr:unnamed protein product [Closterium sp. Naga37s-1]
MAATLSSSASATLRSLSIPEGSSLSTSSRAAIPGFSGLKAQKALSASAQTCTCMTCAKCGNRRTSVVAMASADNQFASVSQSTAAPAAPAATALLPAIVGAGALGAATYVAVKKLTASPAAAPAAPAPSSPAVTSVPPSGIVPRAKHAAASALSTMATTFPSAMQEEAFLKAVAVELAKLGFRKDNGIALVNTCRDEVCRPVVSIIDREFGLSFNISGLGGLVNCGKVGFGAAMSHSPEFPCDVDGNLKERYIFFAFPHVSIGESGEVGSLLRRGRGKASSACGALIAINNDINNGVAPSMDSDDPEYTLLRKKIMAKVSGGNKSLVDVTRAALAAINEDLEKLIKLTVNPETADYAVITGVQIHSGDQIPGQPFRIERTCDYIAPDKMYAVVRGQKYELKTAASPPTPPSPPPTPHSSSRGRGEAGQRVVLCWRGSLLAGFSAGGVLCWQGSLLAGFSAGGVLCWRGSLLAGFSAGGVLCWRGSLLAGFLAGGQVLLALAVAADIRPPPPSPTPAPS